MTIEKKRITLKKDEIELALTRYVRQFKPDWDAGGICWFIAADHEGQEFPTHITLEISRANPLA